MLLLFVLSWAHHAYVNVFPHVLMRKCIRQAEIEEAKSTPLTELPDPQKDDDRVKNPGVHLYTAKQHDDVTVLFVSHS